MEKNVMGAVRPQVKLVNAVDDELVYRGLLAPKNLRQVETRALVDTGAVMLVIPRSIADQLGVRILGQQVARYADSREARVDVTGPIRIECMGRFTIDEARVVGDEVLIGQVILEKLDLLVDCKNQQHDP